MFADFIPKIRKIDEIQHLCRNDVSADELMQPLHDRMPVIIKPGDYGTWLNPALQDRQRLQFLLCPYNADQMEAYPVSTKVNSPQYQEADCIEPLVPTDME